MYRSYNELNNPEEKGKDQYSIISIEDKNQKIELIEQNRLLCVEIYADWCGPCKQIAADYSMMAAKYGTRGALLVKELYEKKLSSDIQGVPTFRFFLDGKMINEEVVGADLDSVEKIIQKLLATDESQTRGPPTGRNQVRNKPPSYGSY